MFWQGSDLLECDAVSVDEWFPTICGTVNCDAFIFKDQAIQEEVAIFLGLLTQRPKHHSPSKHLEALTLLPSNQQHSCKFWKTSVLSIAAVRTWNLAQLHLCHSTQCLIPHYRSLHCHFVSWGTVFRPYVGTEILLIFPWVSADVLCYTVQCS
jgi:hypothetical protein